MTRFSSLGPRIFSPAGGPHDILVSAFSIPVLVELERSASGTGDSPNGGVRDLGGSASNVPREDSGFSSGGKLGE